MIALVRILDVCKALWDKTLGSACNETLALPNLGPR